MEALKKIPLNQICEIMPSGFFKNNPFRNEKSPSNSLHWNKNNNTWYDFASGQHGDSVDLYMKINNISFRQACQEMQSL
jgi:DNA primase